MRDQGSIARTLPWRITAAVVVAGLLAVGGWVFAQDTPPAPAAPDRANQKVFAIRAPGYVPTGKTQDTIRFDFYYLFF